MHSPPLWLKSINEPVHAADLCQFLWQLHRREISPATPIFDSHRRVTLWNHELFRIKCPFYNPFIPSHPSLSLPLSLSSSFLPSLPPTLPFPLPPASSLSLSVPRTSTLFGLIAPQRPSSAWHDSVTSKSWQDEEVHCTTATKKRILSRGIVFSEKGV